MRKIILKFPGGRYKAFTMSFDDGLKSDRPMVELCKKYGLKATFNICSGNFGKGDCVDEDEAVELYDNEYCEVASHGYEHRCLGKIPVPDAMMDVVQDRIKLEQMFGKLVHGHIYPYGNYTDDVKTMVRLAGFEYCRTAVDCQSFLLPKDWYEWNPTSHIGVPAAQELLDKFLAYNESYYEGVVFYVWAHTYEFKNFFPWERVEEFCKKISGHDDIWYATNLEICRYVKAYRSLEYFADGTHVYNPTQIDVWIGCDYGTKMIPAGKLVDLRTGEAK